MKTTAKNSDIDRSINESFNFYGIPCLFYDNRYHLFNYRSLKSVVFQEIGELSNPTTINFLKKSGIIESEKANTDCGSELHLTFILTTDCNLFCDYCYTESKIQKKYLSPDLAVSIIDSLIDNQYNGRVFVQFFGGEPTLNLNTIKAIVCKIKEKTSNCFFYITTNGTFESETLQYLINEKIGFYISIDGIESDHNIHRKNQYGEGTYAIVYENLLRIISAGLPCKVRSTITPENITNMTIFAKEMFDSGVKLIHFTSVSSIGFARSLGKTSYEEFEDSYCQQLMQVLDIAKYYNAQVVTPLSMVLGRHQRPYCKVFKNNSKIIIAPDGKRTLCYGIQSSSNSCSQNFLYGKFNLNNSKFVLRSYVKDSICNAYDSIVEEHCINCFAFFACSGGCFLQNVSTNNSLNVLDKSFCSLQKKLILLLVKRILK